MQGCGCHVLSFYVIYGSRHYDMSYLNVWGAPLSTILSPKIYMFMAHLCLSSKLGLSKNL